VRCYGVRKDEKEKEEEEKRERRNIPVIPLPKYHTNNNTKPP
jgi:hypothetical protein